MAGKAVAKPPSAKKAPVAKKAVKKVSGDKKRSKKSVESYKIYIYKVLKQVQFLRTSVSVVFCQALLD